MRSQKDVPNLKMKNTGSQPETCLNPDLLPPVQQEIFDQIQHFEVLKKLTPK